MQKNTSSDNLSTISLLTQIGRLTGAGFQRVSAVVGGIAAVLLVAMMVITGVDVVLRYFFNRPLIGGFEVNAFLMVLVVFFGLAYTLVKRGHVSINLLVSRFGHRTQAIINSITSLMAVGLFSLISWQTVLQAGAASDAARTSVELGISLTPFMLAAAFGSALLSIVYLVDFAKFLAGAIKG
ncbi:TRAP transporter small permease [Chloroflexota bacterium]